MYVLFKHFNLCFVYHIIRAVCSVYLPFDLIMKSRNNIDVADVCVCDQILVNKFVKLAANEYEGTSQCCPQSA